MKRELSIMCREIRSKPSSSQSALSLLEILLAMALLGISVTAILSVYTFGMRQSVHAERVLKATELCREVMENVRQMDPGNIPANGSVFDGRTPDAASSGFPPAPYPGRDDLKIQVLVDDIEPRLKSVSVKVYFRKGQSVDVQSYFHTP